MADADPQGQVEALNNIRVIHGYQHDAAGNLIPILQIYGGTFIPLYPRDDDHPDGYLPDQFITAQFLMDMLKLLLDEMKIQTAETVRLRRALETYARRDLATKDPVGAALVPNPDLPTAFSGPPRNSGV